MEKPRPRFDPHATDADERRTTLSHLTDPSEWRYGLRCGIGMVSAGLAIILVLDTLVGAGAPVHPEVARQLTAAYMVLLVGGLVVGSASVITRKTRSGQREILAEVIEQWEDVRHLREELAALSAEYAALQEEITGLRLAKELHAQSLRAEFRDALAGVAGQIGELSAEHGEFKDQVVGLVAQQEKLRQEVASRFVDGLHAVNGRTVKFPRNREDQTS